jgi:TonB family protein
LQHFFHDLFTAIRKKQTQKSDELIDSLRLPDEGAWFVAAFGDESGPKLAGAYAKLWPGYRDTLENIFGNEAHDEKSKISAQIETEASWPVKQLAGAMKSRVTFYTASTVKGSRGPGTLPGHYVYAQGSFRVVPYSVFTMLSGIRPLRLRVGGNVQQAKLVHSPQPVYPQEAKDQHIQGTVLLHVIVAMDGSLAEVQPVSGDTMLIKAAVDAIQQWRYQPTLLNGDPVEVDTTISVVFTLQN